MDDIGYETSLSICSLFDKSHRLCSCGLSTNYSTCCSVLNFELLSSDMKGNQFPQYIPTIDVEKDLFYY